MRGKGVKLNGEEEEGWQEEEIEERRNRGGDLRRCGDTLQGKGVRLDGEEKEGWQEEEIRMMPRWGGLPPAVFIIMEIIGAEGGRGIEARHTKSSG